MYTVDDAMRSGAKRSVPGLAYRAKAPDYRTGFWS
jgi:hypothetical protein